jgi:hypothetical protein
MTTDTDGTMPEDGTGPDADRMTDGTVPDADRMTDGTMTDDGPVPAVKGKSTDTTVTRPAASVARVLGTPADAAEF